MTSTRAELPGIAGGKDGRRPAARAKAAENRHAVMTMLTAGAAPADIAKALGMKLSRVDRIIRNVLATWENTDLRAVEATREAQLRRIDALVRTLWVRATDPSRPDLRAVAEIRQLEALRADLVGTRAAKKVELAGSIGFHLDTDERDRLEQAWASGTLDGEAVELVALEAAET